jgi:uncharacterized protein YbaP (TraB family)
MAARHAMWWLSALTCVAVGACDRSSPLPENAGPSALPTGGEVLAHPLLWKIEKDGHTSYALGTIHGGVDARSRLPPRVWARLDAARAFAMETDVSDPDLVHRLRDRDDGKTLHEDLGDAYWNKLETAVSPKVARQLDTHKAVVAVALLSTRGLPDAPAMDGALLARATAASKPVVFLEPPRVQADVLARWFDVRALEEMLDDLADNERQTRDMLAAYVAGDEARILQVNDEGRSAWQRHGHSDAEYSAQLDDLLYRRNASWIAPIERLHAAGGGFIAVGALHLVGAGSVLDRLRALGYTITREP